MTADTTNPPRNGAPALTFSQHKDINHAKTYS